MWNWYYGTSKESSFDSDVTATLQLTSNGLHVYVHRYMIALLQYIPDYGARLVSSRELSVLGQKVVIIMKITRRPTFISTVL